MRDILAGLQPRTLLKVALASDGTITERENKIEINARRLPTTVGPFRDDMADRVAYVLRAQSEPAALHLDKEILVVVHQCSPKVGVLLVVLGRSWYGAFGGTGSIDHDSGARLLGVRRAVAEPPGNALPRCGSAHQFMKVDNCLWPLEHTDGRRYYDNYGPCDGAEAYTSLAPALARIELYWPGHVSPTHRRREQVTNSLRV